MGILLQDLRYGARMVVNHHGFIGIGIVCCAAVSRILSSVLYGISPHDPVSFLFVPEFLWAVALVASYRPARRATKVDPMEALRYE